MAWFRNCYRCGACGYGWTAEWSSRRRESACPRCAATDASPFESDDLTERIELYGGRFLVLWSPETARHEPDYRVLGDFGSYEEAVVFLTT